MVQALSSSSPDVIQTISLKYPFARLSSSPASSPHLVDLFPSRRDSIHPNMSGVLSRELVPEAHLFSDNSSDNDWEGNARNMMQTVTVDDNIRSEGFSQDMFDRIDCVRKRQCRERSIITSLPRFTKASVYGPEPNIEDDRTNVEYASDGFERYGRGPKRARKMSLHRPKKDTVRLVQTSSSVNSPRHSIRSSHFDTASPIEDMNRARLVISPTDFEESRTISPLSQTFRSWHETKTSESMMAGSVINAHAATIRALESRDISPIEAPNYSGFTYLQSAMSSGFAKSSSCPNSCRTTMSSLLSANGNRLFYLPSHFTNTPHPFTTNKECGKFKPHPRQSRIYPCSEDLDADGYVRLNSSSGEEVKTPYDGHKGKRILGLVASEDDVLHQTRLGRNKRAQAPASSDAESGSGGTKNMVWLSLQQYGGRKHSDYGMRRKMIRFVVPNMSSLHNSNHLEKTPLPNEDPPGFDDKRFGEHLQAAHRKLAGSWFRRAFSAHKLHTVRLSQSSVWSGTRTPTTIATIDGLLAVEDGIFTSERTKPLLTEEGLMKLFRKPQTGEGRYMWVHWVRQVAASNSLMHTYPHAGNSGQPPPSMVTTIEFLHAPSTFRIVTALVLALLGCVAAALLWIFIGPGGVGAEGHVRGQRSERVGDSMGVSVLVLMLEGVGVCMWILFS
jgi:hypothetical protein